MTDFNITQKLMEILIWAIPVIFAITVHEVAHGWVASKLGDNTAKMLGRLTLNPIKHIDLFGTIILPVMLLLFSGFVFGWAKPVPVNWRNLRHPRRDMAIVAAAGPLANLAMALIWCMLGYLASGGSGAVSAILLDMSRAGVMINAVLMILNILPLQPLDGSRVVSSLLPPPLAARYDRIEPYGFWILLALLATGILSAIMMPPLQIVVTWFYSLMG
jgi:Zn-dependent protease